MVSLASINIAIKNCTYYANCKVKQQPLPKRALANELGEEVD